MNKMLSAFFLSLITLLVIGCSCPDGSSHAKDLKSWMTPNGKIKVLSTVAMIDDLVKQVGGDHIDTTVLIKGELDPHSYQLVKGDNEKLFFADIIFANGLGLEHGPSLQDYLQKQSKVVSIGNKIAEASPGAILHYKGQVDPHIWMDISLWAKTIPIIAAALEQKDPAHAADYRSNAAKLLATFEDAHNKVKKQIQEIPPEKRYLVTSHDAFNYFARSYLAEEGETSQQWMQRFMAPEGLAPESQISTTDIQALVDHLKKYNIHVIFPESNVNRDSIRKIVQAAKENGLDVHIADIVLYADAMGKPGSDSNNYLNMIQHNVDAITTHLRSSNKKAL